jgi:ribosomal protein S4
MRKSSKYKKFNSSGTAIVKKTPLRILKFRRPKWASLQKVLTRKRNKRKVLINPFTTKSTFKSWERVRKYYKRGFQNRNMLCSIYDSSIKFKTLRKKVFSKSFKRKDVISHYLVEPQYKLDILLWDLHFFSSVYQARQKISNRQILANGKSIQANILLRKGDVITFKSWDKKNDFFFNKSVKKYFLNEKFITFLEVDYYTKTIVILKNFDRLSSEDKHILITDFVPLKSLHYNI